MVEEEKRREEDYEGKQQQARSARGRRGGGKEMEFGGERKDGYGMVWYVVMRLHDGMLKQLQPGPARPACFSFGLKGGEGRGKERKGKEKEKASAD